jgi:hypothetical protein
VSHPAVSRRVWANVSDVLDATHRHNKKLDDIHAALEEGEHRVIHDRVDVMQRAWCGQMGSLCAAAPFARVCVTWPCECGDGRIVNFDVWAKQNSSQDEETVRGEYCNGSE